MFKRYRSQDTCQLGGIVLDLLVMKRMGKTQMGYSIRDIGI